MALAEQRRYVTHVTSFTRNIKGAEFLVTPPPSYTARQSVGVARSFEVVIPCTVRGSHKRVRQRHPLIPLCTTECFI